MATQVAFSNLDSWLQSQPANTVNTPYELEITGLTASDIASSDTSGTLGYVINSHNTKYVDLSETTLPSVTSMSSTFYDCTSLVSAPAIPSGVTDLYYTFRDCTSLTNAPVIPDSVTSIEGAFSLCESLTNAPIIPDGVTNMIVSFIGCTSLVNAPVIPDGVTNMRSAFSGCTSLVNAPVIPDGVTNMRSTFSDCTSLVCKPIIPSTVTSRTDCYANVTTKNWKGTESQAESFVATFFTQTSDSEIQVYNSDRITYEYSIYNVDISNLSTHLAGLDANTVSTAYKIYIRGLTTSNATNIRTALVANHSKYVDLSYTTIPQSTDCTSLFDTTPTLTKSPILPTDATSLVKTFYWCYNLREAPTIPSGVTNMVSTFVNCGITTPPVIPNGVTIIRNCFTFTNITIAPVLPNGITDLEGTFSDTKITTPPVIPSSVTNMSRTFASCQYLTTAPVIPEGVTTITMCFSDCPITTVPYIPSTITNGEGAFNGCTSLTKIDEFKIPLNTLKNNSNFRNMFANCPNLETIGYNPEADQWHAFRLKFGASSVEGKVFDINGVGTAIASTSITKDTVNMPVLTDELWFPDSNTSDADIETLIGKVIQNRYTYWKKEAIDPTAKSLVLYADDPNNVVSNFIPPAPVDVVQDGNMAPVTSNAVVNGGSDIINNLTTGTSTPTDDDYYVAQYAGGGTTNTSYHRRTHSALWEYIKGKISTVLGLTNTAYGGNSSTATRVQGIYTGSGGQQNPQYVGKGYARFNMMNNSVLSDTTYKNWLLMDCYTGFDAGGASALGISRTQLRAYVLQSDAGTSPNRPTSWTRSGEIPIITAKSFSTAGYVIFSNGLKIQWGYVSKGSNLSAGTSWAPSISFSNYGGNFTGGYTVIAGNETTTGGTEICVKSKTLTGFTFHLYNRNGSTAMPNPIVYFLAIGY